MKKHQIMLVVFLFWYGMAKGQDTSRYEIRYITLDQALQEGDGENSVVKRKRSNPLLEEEVNGYRSSGLIFLINK